MTTQNAKTTTAEKVAEMFGDNGQIYDIPRGGGRVTLDAICREAGARVTDSDRGTAYRFADGSAIIDCGSAWDIAAGPNCYCWEGAGHSEDCEAQQ